MMEQTGTESFQMNIDALTLQIRILIAGIGIVIYDNPGFVAGRFSRDNRIRQIFSRERKDAG
jgi:hypothetical protein